MEFSIESISPAKALEYLRHNVDNYRKLSRTRYKQYAEVMKSGKWQLNGESIKFAENGILKDGQHRLAGIVESGKTIKMVVVRGVPDSVNIFDIGMERTANQMIKAQLPDYDISPTISAVARLILSNFQANPTRDMITEYAVTHIDELSRAYRCTVYGTKPFSKKTACIAASYILLRNELLPCYEIELFFRLFNTSGSANAEGYDPGPAIVARRQFKGREGTGDLLRKEQLEILLNAMTDFHEGKSRAQEYKIKEPFICEGLISKIHKKDGLR